VRVRITIEVSRPRWCPRWLARATVATVLLGAVAVPTTVWASHQYTDVATQSSYHDEIEAVTDAGITKGCAAGQFCPTDFIRRDHLATWLTRTASRATMNTTLLLNTIRDFNTEQVAGRITITVPGIPNTGKQFVAVWGQVDIQEGNSDCPCTVFASLRPTGANQSTEFGDGVLHVPTGGVFFDVATVWAHGVVAASPGTRTYDLVIQTIGATSNMDVLAVRLTAMTSPFGGTGGDTL
jgi:hypothetical protein